MAFLDSAHIARLKNEGCGFRIRPPQESTGQPKSLSPDQTGRQLSNSENVRKSDLRDKAEVSTRTTILEPVPSQPESIAGPLDASIDPKRDFILRILQTAENGSPSWGFSQISIMHDGPNRRLQLTYGIQFDEAGDLGKLLSMYCSEGGQYGTQIAPYLQAVNKGTPSATILSQAKGFQSLLRQAGTDKIMQDLEIKLFMETSWNPAVKWSKQNGFVLPLSFLIIADSFLQSNQMLGFLLRRVQSKTPVADRQAEQEWITSYATARNKWLEASGGALTVSSYRTKCYLSMIQRSDWQLNSMVSMNGYRLSAS